MKYNKRKNIWLVYSVLFLLTSLLVYLPYFANGKSLLWNVDGVRQQYFFINDLRKIMGQLLRGEGFNFWSWKMGLGADVIGSYASSVLGDPFAYLTALFPVNMTEVGYSFTIILRLYVMGAAFLGFMRKLEMSKMKSLLSAFMYTFSSWMFLVSVRQPFFLNAAIVFVFLILGLEKVFRKERPYIFIFSVLAALVTSFYFAFMSAIVAVVYFFIRYFLEYNIDKSLKSFFKTLGRVSGFACIGVLLSMPVLLQAVYAVLSAPRGNGLESDVFYNTLAYMKFIPAILVNSNFESINGYNLIGMPVLAFVMLPVIFLRWKEYKSVFITFCILVIFILFPIFGAVINGFAYSVGRWAYALVFFWAWLVAICYKDNMEYSKKEINIMQYSLMGVLIYVFVLIFLFFAFDTKALATVAISVSSGFALLYIFKEYRSKVIAYGKANSRVLGVVMINIILVAWISQFPGMGDLVREGTDFGMVQKELKTSSQRIASKIKDDDLFYRVDVQEGIVKRRALAELISNESLFFNNNTISIFHSIIDSDWDEFNSSIMNTAASSWRVGVNGNDERTRLNTLLGVKYFIGTNKSNEDYKNNSAYCPYGYERKKSIDHTEIYQNKYNLGVGFVYDAYITEREFNRLTPLERESALMQAVVIPDKDINKQYKMKEYKFSEINSDIKEVPFTISGDIKGNTVINKKGAVSIDLDADEIINSELYVMIDNMKLVPFSDKEKFELATKGIESKLEINNIDKSQMFKEANEDYAITVKKDKISKGSGNHVSNKQGKDNTSFLFNMGYYKKTKGKISIDFHMQGSYTFDDIKVYAVSMDSYDEQAKKLEESKFNVTALRNNYVKGSTNVQECGVLYLSVLNNAGWDIYVDGKKQEHIFKANIGFTGIYLEAGEHIVEMKYRPFGFDYSLLMFGAGVLAMIGIAVYRRKHFGKKHEILNDIQ